MDLREYIQAGSAIKRHPWELVRLKMLRYCIRKTIKEKKLITDVGSGDAFLAGGIALAYPTCTVIAADINYDADLMNKLERNKPSNLHFTNNLSSIQTDVPANAVVLMDVLEHIEYPENLLKELLDSEQTNNETIFVITVPAYQSLFSQHDINLGHYRRYTLTDIEQLLTSHSLQMIYTGYCYNSLLPIRRWQVKKERKKTGDITIKEGIYNWKGGKLLTFLITTLLWIEFKLSWYLARIGIKLPGLTCYCICKPSL